MPVTDSWIWWTFGLICLLGGAGYGILELLAWWDRAQIVALPTGFRFMARGFQVEVHRPKSQLLVRTDRGRYQQAGGDSAEPVEKSGPLNANFAALGLRLSVTPEMLSAPTGATAQHSGYYTLNFDNTEERAQLSIDKVPRAVIVQYEHFATQVGLWVEKIELRQKQEAQAQAAAAAALEAEAEAEREKAAAKAGGAGSGQTLTPDAQVALWRKNAGFSGTSNEIGLDEKGNILWYVDLDQTGRITLHADKRTVHTTLEGAEFTSLGGELEIGVRDEFWLPESPKLNRFRIMKGRSPDERRAWRERMEILRNQLDAKNKGPRP